MESVSCDLDFLSRFSAAVWDVACIFLSLEILEKCLLGGGRFGFLVTLQFSGKFVVVNVELLQSVLVWGPLKQVWWQTRSTFLFCE